MIKKLKNAFLDVKNNINWSYALLITILLNICILEDFTFLKFVAVNLAICALIMLAYFNKKVGLFPQDSEVKPEGPNLEIERKFLLKLMPPIPVTSEKDKSYTLRITQFYLPNGERYRVSTNLSDGTEKYYLTKKKEISHGVYEEDETEISKEVFVEKDKSKVRTISKVRHVVPYKDGMKWEIDDYTSCKMVTLEIELPSIDHSIEIPEWIQDVMVMELTGIREFSNFNLATKV